MANHDEACNTAPPQATDASYNTALMQVGMRANSLDDSSSTKIAMQAHSLSSEALTALAYQASRLDPLSLNYIAMMACLLDAPALKHLASQINTTDSHVMNILNNRALELGYNSLDDLETRSTIQNHTFLTELLF